MKSKRKIFTFLGISIVLLVCGLLFIVFYLPVNSKYINKVNLNKDEINRNFNLGTREDEPMYIVKEGDTVDSIAKEYELRRESIEFANNLEPMAELYVGQELRIPPVDGIFVIVAEGDTLDSIANEYGASTQVIADFNWLDVPYSLELGQEIFVPTAF